VILIFKFSFTISILDLISRLHLALFLIMLDNQLKYPNSPTLFIHLFLGYLLLHSFHLFIFSLLLPIPKYMAACCDPYREGQMNALYRIQKKVAPFTYYTKYSDWESVAQSMTLALLCVPFKAYSAERLGNQYATGCHVLTIWMGLIIVRKLGTVSKGRI
jgi:hypothetical protein